MHLWAVAPIVSVATRKILHLWPLVPIVSVKRRAGRLECPVHGAAQERTDSRDAELPPRLADEQEASTDMALVERDGNS